MADLLHTKRDEWRNKSKLSYFDQYDKHELDTSFATPEFEQEVMNLPKQESKSSETAETLARLREDSTNSNRQFRFPDQDELKKIRMGRVLRDKDFLRMLNTIIPARYSSATRHGMLGLQVLIPTVNGGEWRFVCGVQGGYMPEYSTMYFDAHDLPTSEMYRGWRTVLLRLVQGEFITDERKLDKVFGYATGPESGRYLAQMYHFRNRRFQ